MAKKYLKYFVTREDQNLTDGFEDYMVNFPEHKHLFNTMSVHTWHLYEMIQDAFYCNWPNTNNKKYFINAQPFVIQSDTTVSDDRDHDFLGTLFVNPTGNKLTFLVDDQVQEIELNNSVLLISPHQKERYTISCGDTPLLIIIFRISSSLSEEGNWVPF
jgi:hypothetical protein